MATITIPSAKVIEACEKTIASIIKARADSDENQIQYHLSQTWHTWYFKPYRPTRVEVLKMLQTRGRRWDSGITFPSNYAWNDCSHAQKLLKLAQNGDPVTLNEEDVRVIF